jgi:hypothetical protein
LAGNTASFPLGKISSAPGIKSDVNDGLLEDNFMKAELGAEKRDDFQPSYDAIHVSEGNLGGGLTAVNGNTSHINLEKKRSGMDAANFDAAPGDSLDFGDKAAAHERLE